MTVQSHRRARATADSPALRVPAHRDTTSFLAEALRAPREIGAVAPSGRRLAAAAGDQFTRVTGPQVVVELGPGGGAITDVLHDRMSDADTLIAVEINATMVDHLAASRPWLQVLQGDAADLPALLRGVGIEHADVIISALPWSVIPDRAQDRLLDAITAVLPSHGIFATVLTVPVLGLPRTRRFRQRLGAAFAEVTYHPVWRNLPPARLYVSRRPRRPKR